MTGPSLWFTRATLRRHAPDVAPLINTLIGEVQEGRRLNTAHRLIWTLMPAEMQQAGKPVSATGDKAAFLWRALGTAEGVPQYYLLGPRPREDSAFLDVETKPWSPAFVPGDRLTFDLVVNATIDRMVSPEKGREGRRRVDLVMDAMIAQERAGEAAAPRAIRRNAQAAETLAAWWKSQGARNGFQPLSLNVEDYRTVPLDDRRTHGKYRPQLGVSRLTGSIAIDDPALFAARVAMGFGRAKAFGCGLMLMKRAI